jgi:5-methylcytosine-specific restriction endonuclease McrA
MKQSGDIVKRRREYYQKNKEIILNHVKDYYNKHKLKILDRVKEYRIKNKEIINKKKSDWAKSTGYYKEYHQKNYPMNAERKNALRRLNYARDMKNKEKRLNYNKKWIAEHPERVKERSRRHYQNNKEKFKEYHKKYILKIGIEKIRLQRKLLRKKNREKILSWQRKHYQKNHDRIMSRRRMYNERNRNHIKEVRRRYALSPNGKEKKMGQLMRETEFKNSIVHSFTPKEWLTKKEDTNGLCPICKQQVGLIKMTMDHDYSKYKAYLDFLKTGMKRIYTIDNVMPMCNSCNSKKNILDFDSFIKRINMC